MSQTSEPGQRSVAFAVEHLQGVLVMRIGGELDLLTVPDLRVRVVAATEQAIGPVVIDLTDVGFLSSAGLQLLISVHSDLAAENRMLGVVTGDNRPVVRPMQVTGLDQLLALHPDLSAALAASRVS
jgi:anti-anti-sigma factor